MTDGRKKSVSKSVKKDDGILLKFASKVNPAKLFTKEKHTSNNIKEKRTHKKSASVEFSIPLESSSISDAELEHNHHPHNQNHCCSHRRSRSRNSLSSNEASHDFHDSHTLNSFHNHAGSAGLERRSKSTSSLSHMRLEYNPYGIFNYHNIKNLGSTFATGHNKSESETIIPNPTANPNDFLPEIYKEPVQQLEEKYELVHKSIGTGGSATIKKVYLKDDTLKSNSFALKKFSIYIGETQDKYYNRVATEYTITRSLLHLHCIRCYELLQLPVTLQRAWGMVLNYYEYDLYKLIRNPDWKKVPFAEKMCIFKQICFGLKYIHEQDIAHLDIKAENVMIARNGLMKITDFGCSEIGHEEHGNFRSNVALKLTRLGTPPYQPPEVAKYALQDKEKRIPYCPFKFDYWSLGILLYIIVIGRVPFTSTKELDSGFQRFSNEYAFFLQTNPLFPQDLSNKVPLGGVYGVSKENDPDFIYFFWRLCDPHPKTRMTLPKLFHNKVFQKLEMCVDEKLYEYNFCKHTRSKQMHFDIPVGDFREITEQKEIKHSMWDDIPTVTTFGHSSIKPDPLLDNQNAIESEPMVLNDTTRNLSIVDEGEEEEDNEKGKIEETKEIDKELSEDSDSDDAPVSKSINSISRRSSISYSYTYRSRGNSTPNTLSSNSEPILNPTYRSVVNGKPIPPPSAFVYPDGDIQKSLFADDDYQNSETEYMIVNFQDICDACNYTVVPHSHNMLYSYKEKPFNH